MRYALRLAALTAAIFVVTAVPATAHPLGNFTVNRFAGVEVFDDRVVVHYVVDMAEIPTLQETPRLDANSDDRVTTDELSGYSDERAREWRAALELTAEGRGLMLDVVDARAGLSGGQGGLDVLRVDVTYKAALGDPEADLYLADRNDPGKLGWREIVAYATGRQGIVDATVPGSSVTNELRTYPQGRLSSPLSVTEATIRVAPGAAMASSRPRGEAAEVGPGDLFASLFASLVERDLSPGFGVFAVLLAIAAGAIHALGPGHGKTVMAAYLVGGEGRPRHAVVVGAAISLMHTTSVVVLGMVTLWASSIFPPERVYPWLSLASGMVVLCLGAYLFGTRLRARRRAGTASHDHSHTGHDPVHDHGHDDHGHSHDHGHGHDAGEAVEHSHGFGYHTHEPATTESPLSWKGLAALALSGGLLPSPTALVVLLGAVALHRVAFGMVLVGAFSIGLAGALTLLGLLVLRARSFAAERFGHRSAALLPVLSAAAILVVGMVLTTRAVVGL